MSLLDRLRNWFGRDSDTEAERGGQDGSSERESSATEDSTAEVTDGPDDEDTAGEPRLNPEHVTEVRMSDDADPLDALRETEREADDRGRQDDEESVDDHGNGPETKGADPSEDREP